MIPGDHLSYARAVGCVSEFVHQIALLVDLDLAQVMNDLVRKLQMIDLIRRCRGNGGQIIGLAIGEDRPSPHRTVHRQRPGTAHPAKRDCACRHHPHFAPHLREGIHQFVSLNRLAHFAKVSSS
jgi:hypothetical protein